MYVNRFNSTLLYFDKVKIFKVNSVFLTYYNIVITKTLSLFFSNDPDNSQLIIKKVPSRVVCRCKCDYIVMNASAWNGTAYVCIYMYDSVLYNKHLWQIFCNLKSKKVSYLSKNDPIRTFISLTWLYFGTLLLQLCLVFLSRSLTAGAVNMSPGVWFVSSTTCCQYRNPACIAFQPSLSAYSTLQSVHVSFSWLQDIGFEIKQWQWG